MLTKTIYYDFIPTKDEEEARNTRNIAFKTRKTLVEIRELYSLSPIDPWVIKKVITPAEAQAKKIVLSHAETFNHIFRHWTMCMVIHVLRGSKQNVQVVWDSTDENDPKRNTNMFLKAGPECEYFDLGGMDLIRDRRLNVGDSIGLFWDINSSSFRFRVLNGGIIS